jgi:hypothetical protein
MDPDRARARRGLCTPSKALEKTPSEAGLARAPIEEVRKPEEEKAAVEEAI